MNRGFPKTEITPHNYDEYVVEWKKAFGSHMREHRKLLRWSAKRVLKKLKDTYGVELSHESLSRIKRGETFPRVRVYIALLDIYNIRLVQGVFIA